MADNVNINLNISGDFKAKIREYTKLITHANNVVKGLKTSLESLAGAGDKGFDSKHITDSLASVQRAFAGFQKINGEDLRKAVEALDPTKLRAFGGALTQFQTELTAELITRITSFSTSLKGLGEAQKTLDSGTLVQQLNALSHAMPALKQAISSDNFRTFSENIKSLHVNTQDIAGIIRLGAALKNINRFSGNANSLSELARGITNLTRIKETSGFLRNVQNIATAGTLLHDMKPIDFTKITKGISALTRVNLSDEQWKDIAKTSSEIKKAFADLRSVKLPNLVGFQEGINLLNQSGAKLTDHIGLTQNIKEIKSSLEQLSSVKMPNLGNLVKNLNKLSDETYDFKKINEHVRQFKKTLGQLHGVHVPSLAGFAKGLTELKNINAGEFQNLNTAISGIPAALEGWNKVKVPNLASFTKGLKELGSGAIDFRQVSDNLKNLPNRLKKLSEIQAPDLAKFSKGIIDLSNTSINATRAANAIDEALTVLSKHSNMQIKLPSLANFAKGLNELTKFTHTKDSLQTQINNINAFVNSFSGLSGIKLPNVQGIANAIHKLSTAAPKDAGTTAAAHIEAIKTSLTGLDKVKVPNLKNFADGFKIIDELFGKKGITSGLKVAELKATLTILKNSLDGFDKIKVPNVKSIAQAFKTLSEPTKYNADGVANVTKNAAKLKQAVEMLEGLDTKLPNLKNLADGFKSLNNVFKSKDVVETGKFGERIKQIKDAATDLTELGKLKLPSLNSLAQGFKVLDSIPKNASNEPAINNFKTNIGKIKEATEELVGLSKIKLPNLKNIADGFRSLDVAIPKGQDATNIGKFKDNVGAIKAAVEGLDKIKLPNLKNLADGFKTLNDITINYKFDSNAKYVSQIKAIANEIKAAFAGFNNIQIPNVKNVADGFKTLNSIGEGSTTKETYQKLSSNMRLLKAALEQIKDFGNVSFPNIKNIAQGMKDLRSLGDMGQELSTKFETVKKALEKIQGISVPNLKTFAEGFRELKKIIDESSKGTGNLNTEKFAKELTALSTALGSFGKVSLPPNLAGFAKGIEAITKVNIDGFSDKFRRLIIEIDKFKINPDQTMLGRFTAVLTMATSAIAQLDSRMQQSQQQFGSFGRAAESAISPLDKLSERIKMFLQYRVISAVFNNFTNQLQSIPATIIEYEKAMSNIQSITGATNETMAKLGDVIKRVASTTKFSADEVADGMTMIAQAGFSASESMQMIQAISDLATGTLTDMKTTVDLVTSAMVVFNIESNNASRVSDVFANAVNKSKLTMDKIKTAFNYIGPVARDAGVSFEETATAMMLLANSGQKASTIGTGLRNVFSTLLNPSKKLREAADAVGISVNDLDPRVNSLRTVVQNLGVVVRDSSVALDVFGKRGATAVLSLTQDMGEFDRLAASVVNVGSAARMAQTQQEGLYVIWKNLADRAKLAAVTIGESGFTAALKTVIKAVSDVINAFNQLSKSTFGVVVIKTTMLTTAFLGLVATVKVIASLGLAAKLAEWGTAMIALNKSALAVLGTLLKFSLWKFPVGVINFFRTGTVAATGMGAAVTGLKTAFVGLWAAVWPLLAITAVVGIFSWLSEKSKEGERAVQRLGTELDGLSNSIASLVDFNKQTKLVKEGTDEYMNAVYGLVKSFRDNENALVGVKEEYADFLRTIDPLEKKLNDGGKALENLNRAMEKQQVRKSAELMQQLGAELEKNYEKAMKRQKIDLSDRQQYSNYGELDTIVTGSQAYAKIIKSTFEQMSRYVNDVERGIIKIDESQRDVFNKLASTVQHISEEAINNVQRIVQAGILPLGTPFDVVKEKCIEMGYTNERVLEAMKVEWEKASTNFANGALAKSMGAFLEEVNKFNFGDNLISGAHIKTLTSQMSELVSTQGNLLVAEEQLKATRAKLIPVTNNMTEEEKETNRALEATIATIESNIKEYENSISVKEKDIAATRKQVESIKGLPERLREAANAVAMYADVANKAGDTTAINFDDEDFQKAESYIKASIEHVAAYTATVIKFKEDMAAVFNNKDIDFEEQIQQADSLTQAFLAKAQEFNKRSIELQRERNENERALTLIRVTSLLGENEQALAKIAAQEKEAVEKYAHNEEAKTAALRKLAEQRRQILEKEVNVAVKAPKGISAMVDETMKAMKVEVAAMKVAIKDEIGLIHQKEEAFKQSNKAIGLSSEQAAKAEQDAWARHTSKLIEQLEDKKKTIMSLFSGQELEAELKPIEDLIKKLHAESIEGQDKARIARLKGAAIEAAETRGRIEAEAKKLKETITREQEKALHEIALLEAQGVVTHEQAERAKAEASIKYIEQGIQLRRQQMLQLAATEDDYYRNQAQIQNLISEIQKAEDEIVKIRRKGMEEQTKVIAEGQKKLAEIEGKMGASAFSAKEQAKITANYEKEFEKRRQLGEENAQALAEAETKPLDKVTQAVQKHAAKRMEIQSKTTEKVASLEKELAQKQEDFERKKLDIIAKYNAKRRDLQTSLQDRLHKIETSDLSGEEKERADIDYARVKSGKAMRGMDEAIRSGDSQALDRISKEFESALGAFEGASKPKQYLGEIMSIYEALQKIIDAQEEIEKNEAERKNNQEVDALTKKIQTANDAMEKSLAVENERHNKTMANLKAEADEIRKQVALAQQLRDTYANGLQLGNANLPNAPTGRAPRNNSTMEGTFGYGVEQMVQAAAQAGTAIEKALEIGKTTHKQMIDGWIADHVLYGKTASGEVKKLNDEQMRILAKSGEEFKKAFPDIGEILKDSDVAGQTEVVTDQFLGEWRKAYEEYKTTADNASIEASQKAIEAYQNISPEMKKVINDAIASGAISGSNSAQQNITAFAQIAQQNLTSIGTGISNGMVQGATDGLDRSRPVLEQLTQDSNGVWQFGPSLAASIQEGVNQAQATTKAWREVELADGRKLYTNLTDAQRQGYADMAAAAKSTAAIMSTEYETLYTRTTIAGKDFYRAITQEEAKAIANKEANALKENELFVKTTERNLEIFQDMSTKMTIGDWSKKFNAAEAEKAAYDTAKKAMGTWTSTVQESEPAYVSVELAEATLNKAETEVEAAKLKIAEKAAEFGVKVHDGSVSEVKAKAEQLIAMIENNRAEILIDLDEKGKRQAVSEVKDLVKELETKETVMLEAEADKKKLDEVNDTVKKLTDDISKKQQILLKPGLDETEKRKILGDIEKLTNDAKAKLSELQVQIKDEDAKKQIAQIIAMLDKIPKETKTKIGVQVNEAIRDIDAVIRKLNSIPKTITTVHKIVTREEKAAGGLVGAYATGGRVHRPEEPGQYADGGQTFRRLPSRYISRGSGHKDDVPALLMKNEFVHRAAAVKKYGLNFMYKLNNLEIPTSITRMFADGGLVSNAITSIQKFATGGLVKSARRKLEDMFSGSGVNLNVDNLNVVGKLEQAADNYTSPIAVQAINTLAKNVEASISKFSNGGILTSSVLTTTQMSAISAKYNALISEARREGNANIAKALSNEQAGIKKLTSELEITLGNLNTSYNKEVQKLTEAHTKRMSDKKAEYERTMASANESYNKRVSEDNRRYAKEDEDYHTSNAKRDKEYSDANVKRDEEYNKSISQLKKDHEKELADLEKTLKDKREAARKEEEQEAKEEAKTQKSYEKEDKRYAKETADRKKAHEKELADAKKEYEDAQFKYETELETKKQEVDAKKAEIENFKNQMASRVFPAHSKKLKEATVEEVMEAHVKQTRAANNGDEYIYDLDLGGTIKKAEPKPPTDEEVKKLFEAIRPRTNSEREHLNKLTTIALNPPYSQQAWVQMEKYNEYLNEATGYTAWRRAAEANKNGKPLEDLKVKQDKPYREYLESHYKTDYQHPYAQAQKDLDDFLKEDSPKVAYDKKVAELKQAYKEAKQEAEEARAEVMEQRKEHAEQLAETRANRAEELRQAQLEYDEGVKTAKENYNTSYKEQTDAYNTEKTEAETAYREDKAAAEKERQESLLDRQNSIAERDKDYKDDIAERKRDYDEYVAENSISYAEDMAAAKENYQSNVDDARSRYGEDVASLKESTKNEVESIKGNMNDSISRAQADMQEDFKSQEDAARQALEEKKDTYSTTNKEAEEALVDSIEHPSTTVAAQESVEKATEKMSEDAVLQKYGMSVEELIRRLSKGLWKFATGGLVPSTATSKPNTDSVLSLLMPNEFVMSAKAVRTFGLDFMHSINNLRLPAFAAGGFAGAGGSASPEIRSFKAGEMAVNKTIHALDLTINNTHIGELMGERNVIDRFIDEMQRARMSLGATA